ncbi:hypothetical protein MNBD_NITROSPINAE01-565 [hydrothermal vent metagenome]|uniref:Uncharacterized protein n=1 Tax=hydrothermal vent metagenome TaxID=652676 RepID=A0A3B1BST6_9ZZZZ
MAKKFYNTPLIQRADDKLLELLACGHDGMIKVVCDIKTGACAGGAEWHAESRDLLKENGSAEENLWGAKLYLKTGKIKFQSMINQHRDGANGDLIADTGIQAKVETLIRRFLR